MIHHCVSPRGLKKKEREKKKKKKKKKKKGMILNHPLQSDMFMTYIY